MNSASGIIRSIAAAALLLTAPTSVLLRGAPVTEAPAGRSVAPQEPRNLMQIPGAPGAAGDGLDLAFRFASAIRSDAKDKGQAQQGVIHDYVEAGRLDEAGKLADQVTGWRRGIAYAEVASALARAGRTEDARRTIRRAEEFRATVSGWQNPRIAFHIARALALTGDQDTAKRLVGNLSGEDRQYAGWSAATAAAAHAARGEFDQALLELGKLAGETDVDVVLLRTQAYLDLARDTKLSPEQRRRALDEAGRSTDGVAGWERAEALANVARAMKDLAEMSRARELLATAEAVIAPVTPASTPLKAAILADLARSWGAVGEKARARAALKEAASAVPSALTIEQPALYATVATAWTAIGDEKEGRRMLGIALTGAEALENARPRALAAVEICRSLAKEPAALDTGTRSRLQALLGGLKDPW